MSASDVGQLRSGGGVFQPANMNLYGYVQQKPVVAIDPNGEEAYAVARDLAALPIGAHSFMAIITQNPLEYSDAMRGRFQAMVNTSGDIPGVGKGEVFHVMTIGGQANSGKVTTVDGPSSSSLLERGEGQLIGVINETNDLNSVREVANGDNSLMSFNATFYGPLDDSNPSTSARELDERIFDANSRYNNSIGYGLLGKGFFEPKRNCHGYCASLGREAGVTNFPSDLFGVDPGLGSLLPEEAFE